MNIALISDEKYAHPSGITIKSILSTSSPENIYVIDAGMTERQSDWLRSLSSCIRIVALPEWVDSWLSQFDMHGDKHVSRTTYAKLVLHKILPDVETVLYVDGDVIALRDLMPLYRKPLGESMIGAACNVLTMKTEQARIGSISPYFNAGVLLCPLNKWREDSVEHAFIDWYKSNISVMRYDDQDIFNGVFSGKVCWIDKRWNVSQFEVLATSPLLQLNPKECGMIHFNGGHKPWNPDYAERWGIDAANVELAMSLLASLAIHEGRDLH